MNGIESIVIKAITEAIGATIIAYAFISIKRWIKALPKPSAKGWLPMLLPLIGLLIIFAIINK